MLRRVENAIMKKCVGKEAVIDVVIFWCCLLVVLCLFWLRF